MMSTASVSWYPLTYGLSLEASTISQNMANIHRLSRRKAHPQANTQNGVAKSRNCLAQKPLSAKGDELDEEDFLPVLGPSLLDVPDTDKVFIASMPCLWRALPSAEDDLMQQQRRMVTQENCLREKSSEC